MKITITTDETAFDQAAAARILAQMLHKPDSVIGFSTGQTTIGMHRYVAEVFKACAFDTSNLTLFNVDELTNLPRTYAGSCYAIIKKQLVEPLGVPEENFIMPPTFSEDFDKECVRFEDELAKRGGVDLQMLGIGKNGHIGINQPGTPFESETWVSPMDPEFEARVRKETGVQPDYELGGLTRGIKNIMQTRKIVLVAKGRQKAEIIRKALFGPVTTDLPASVLQLHPDCECLLDSEAAASIRDLL